MLVCALCSVRQMLNLVQPAPGEQLDIMLTAHGLRGGVQSDDGWVSATSFSAKVVGLMSAVGQPGCAGRVVLLQCHSGEFARTLCRMVPVNVCVTLGVPDSVWTMREHVFAVTRVCLNQLELIAALRHKACMSPWACDTCMGPLPAGKRVPGPVEAVRQELDAKEWLILRKSAGHVAAAIASGFVAHPQAIQDKTTVAAFRAANAYLSKVATDAAKEAAAKAYSAAHAALDDPRVHAAAAADSHQAVRDTQDALAEARKGPRQAAFTAALNAAIDACADPAAIREATVKAGLAVATFSWPTVVAPAPAPAPAAPAPTPPPTPPPASPSTSVQQPPKGDRSRPSWFLEPLGVVLLVLLAVVVVACFYLMIKPLNNHRPVSRSTLPGERSLGGGHMGPARQLLGLHRCLV